MADEYVKQMWSSMRLVNRAAIIVKPKLPYIEWANGLEEGGPKLSPDNPFDEYSVYLVEDIESPNDEEKRIRKYYSRIFEYELFGWHTSAEDWPQIRSLRVFRKWFDIEVHPVVQDLSDYALKINN